MLERRSEPRTSVLLRAVAVFSTLRRECFVLNLSSDGAGLRFPEFVGLPERFDLLIPDQQATYRAQRQWQIGTYVGVSLEDRITDQSALMRRIEQLEAELRDLRAQVRSGTDTLHGEPVKGECRMDHDPVI